MRKDKQRRHPIKSLFLLDVVEDPESRPIFIWAVSTVLIGSFLFRLLEGWSWLDAVYFSVVTLTTVGFGDLTPTHPLSKLLAIFYILNGIVVLLALFDRVRVVRSRRRRRTDD
jgi:voltage-gated potassium channel Kch